MIELWVRACETGPGHEGKEALFKFGIAVILSGTLTIII
jgi:hypothetical protein